MPRSDDGRGRRTGRPAGDRARRDRCAPRQRAEPAAGAGSADPVAGELRRAGVVPLLVLELLGGGPSYGNRLIDGIAELSGGLLAVNPNTMYPLLRSLEDRGLADELLGAPGAPLAPLLRADAGRRGTSVSA